MTKQYKPDPKKIQLWAGYKSDDKFDYSDSYRVICPNKSVYWTWKPLLDSRNNPWGNYPCWATKFGYKYKRKEVIFNATHSELIKAMKAYDKSRGRKTMFLGNF